MHSGTLFPNNLKIGGLAHFLWKLLDSREWG